MGRPGRSEASGLRFDHCLEGVAAQCPLLLQVEADFEAQGTEVINRIDCLAPFVALRTAPEERPFRVGWRRIVAGQDPSVWLSGLASIWQSWPVRLSTHRPARSATKVV